MLMSDPITRVIVILPLFLLAIVLHEVAHGYAAYRLGDDTAKRLGRLTLSPLPHLDPLGTIFLVLSSLQGFGFGWAKPVPVVIERLRNPRRDEVIVTLAGPAANAVQAVAWALLVRAVVMPGAAAVFPTSLGTAIAQFCLLGVILNVTLLVFNLLPIPPLDGSHVAARLLGIEDPHLIGRFAVLGFLALFLLMRFGVWDAIWDVTVRPVVGLLVG